MARRNESALQCALIKWWALAHRGLGVPDERLLFAIPNGGKRDAITGARLKKEGARAGVPDLFLAVPRDVTSKTTHIQIQPPSGSITRTLCVESIVTVRKGLFIELKTWEGHATTSQKEVMAALRAQGYAAVVCHGVEQAMRAIDQYLHGKEISL